MGNSHVSRALDQSHQPKLAPRPAIRLLVADEHPLIRLGLRALAGASPDIRVIGEAGSSAEVVQLFRQLRPNVCLLDVAMERRAGMQATQQILREAPDARLIGLASYEGDEDIHQTLQSGMRGYLSKRATAADTEAAIRTVHAGHKWLPPLVLERLAQRVGQRPLTRREREVLALIAEGQCNATIAARLQIATGTVKIHVKAILAKLGADDRTEAAAMALRRGFVHLD